MIGPSVTWCNGPLFDNQGNDIRVTGTLNPCGEGGARLETYVIHRLWDDVFKQSVSGMPKWYGVGAIFLDNVADERATSGNPYLKLLCYWRADVHALASPVPDPNSCSLLLEGCASACLRSKVV